MKQLLLIWSLLNTGSFLCYSQQMDTFILKDFEARGFTGTGRPAGTSKLSLNTKNYNTLTDALQNQSALFIKIYGTGALATAGMRGMGAQHTAVLWNGININSCMNSNVDFNLIPLFMIDQASVETGAGSTTCGNGAIAGAIYLSNDIESGSRCFANLQMGSFGYYQVGAGTVYKVGKVTLKTRLLYRQAENDILYHNKFVAYAPLERQENSAYSQKGILQEADFKLKGYNRFKIDAWYLETSRELPGAMGSNNLSKERQYDLNVRMALSHQYNRTDKLNIKNKLAVLYDQLNYYNIYYPAAYNVSKTFIAETEWLFKINRKNRITNSINNNFSTARTDGYSDWPQRNMLSYWLNYEWRNNKENLLLSAGSRWLLIDRKFAPASPDMAIQYTPFRNLKIKGNLAYSYRVPSFNDFYWQPGGNKDLKPERGFKQELSVEVRQRKFKMAATGFHHVVNDWIMWLDVDGSGIWKAQNALEVTSTGFEISGEYVQSFGHHDIQLIGRYQFVKSIHSEVYVADEDYLNKQLPYTPYHTAAATLNYRFKQFFLSGTEQFNGSRYTSADNSFIQSLPAYFLTNATVGYQFDLKKQHFLLSFTCNNLFGASYQIMENRPMPLVNYQTTLKYNINNEK